MSLPPNECFANFILCRRSALLLLSEIAHHQPFPKTESAAATLLPTFVVSVCQRSIGHCQKLCLLVLPPTPPPVLRLATSTSKNTSLRAASASSTSTCKNICFVADAPSTSTSKNISLVAASTPSASTCHFDKQEYQSRRRRRPQYFDKQEYQSHCQLCLQ